MRFTIRQRLQALIIAFTVFCVLGGAFLYRSLSNLQAAIAAGTQYTAAVRQQMQADMMHDAMRGDVFIALHAGVTKNNEALQGAKEEFDEHAKQFKEALGALEAAHLDNDIGDALSAIRPSLEAYVKQASGVMDKVSEDYTNAEQKLPAFGTAFSALEQALGKLGDTIEAHAKASEDAATRSASWTKNSIIISLAIAIPLVILIGYLIAASITRPVGRLRQFMEELASGNADLTKRMDVRSQDELGAVSNAFDRFMNLLTDLVGTMRSSAVAVVAAADQLSAATTQVSEASKSQSEAASSTASAVEEVTVSIGSVAQNAEEAHELASASLRHTEASGQSMHSLVQEIQKVEAAVGQIASSVSEFVKSTHAITGMTKQVKDIAEQTNLLALNAAIEAARAGEQGRGFAVVADEVRKLAEKSGQSANEIDAVTRTLGGQSQAVEKAIELGLVSLNSSRGFVETVVQVLAQARSSVETAAKGVAQISNSVKEQSEASGEISKHVERIARMTDDNHEVVNSAAQAANKLQSLADGLQAAVSKFKTA